MRPGLPHQAEVQTQQPGVDESAHLARRIEEVGVRVQDIGDLRMGERVTGGVAVGAHPQRHLRATVREAGEAGRIVQAAAVGEPQRPILLADPVQRGRRLRFGQRDGIALEGDGCVDRRRAEPTVGEPAVRDEDCAFPLADGGLDGRGGTAAADAADVDLQRAGRPGVDEGHRQRRRRRPTAVREHRGQRQCGGIAAEGPPVEAPLFAEVAGESARAFTGGPTVEGEVAPVQHRVSSSPPHTADCCCRRSRSNTLERGVTVPSRSGSPIADVLWSSCDCSDRWWTTHFGDGPCWPRSIRDAPASPRSATPIPICCAPPNSTASPVR